jgi:hypothetical protein
MKYSYILILFLSISLSAQYATAKDVEKLALEISKTVNKNPNPISGVIQRGVSSYSNTLVYMYDVPQDWYAEENMKQTIIENYNELDIAKMYINFRINTDFHYYRGSKLVKRIGIKSHEFLNKYDLNGNLISVSKKSSQSTKLGEYVIYENHPKAKGVNFKVKKPNGWEKMEGDRPNVVQKFLKGTNSYMTLILDTGQFISKSQGKELLNDEEIANEMANGMLSVGENSKLISKKYITVDNYPSLEIIMETDVERIGVIGRTRFIIWNVFYEDRLVQLMAGTLIKANGVEVESDWKSDLATYRLVTNSMIFPDQY